jgi:E3 ubiquitin-protein ligase UHRF1
MWDFDHPIKVDMAFRPWVGGISGSKAGGAYSIALSGGYDDDVDLGYGL